MCVCLYDVKIGVVPLPNVNPSYRFDYQPAVEIELHKLHLLLTLFPLFSLLPLQVLKLGQSGGSGPSVTCLHPAT